MRLLTALGLSAALLLSAQPAAALNAPTLRTKSVCLAELKAANKAKRAPQLKNCRFGAITLKNANFRNADLRGADFSPSKPPYDLPWGSKGANLSGADFRGAKLARTIFYWAKLAGTNFTNADLTKTKFTNPLCTALSGTTANDCTPAHFSPYPTGSDDAPQAILVGANFSGVLLSHTGFFNADLTNANFSGAYLAEAYFVSSNLTSADFRGADITSARFDNANLTNANFSGLIRSPYFYPAHANQDGVLWSNTTMPDGTIYP